MADIETAAWSETAASNIAASPDGWPPNSSPNIVYTTDREMMGAIKRDWNRRNATVTAGGTANALTLSFTVNPTALVQGQRYAFIAAAANTGPATLQVGALAATAIQANGAALVGGELRTGLITEVIYTGSAFVIIAGSGAGSGAYLPFAGGTLTGGLIIAPASGAGLTINGAVSQININKPAGANANNLIGQTATSPRWNVQLGNSASESGSNAGSDFTVNRYSDAGAFIDVPLTITRASGAVAIKGTSTNDSAAAGFVGEVISSNVTSGVALTSGTTATVTSILLTAGDWDLHGEVWFTIGTGGASSVVAAMNTVSSGLPGASAIGTAKTQFAAAITASFPVNLALSPTRASLAATTTYYLLANAGFGSGTITAAGNIWARRMR